MKAGQIGKLDSHIVMLIVKDFLICRRYMTECLADPSTMTVEVVQDERRTEASLDRSCSLALLTVVGEILDLVVAAAEQRRFCLAGRERKM